MIYLDMWSKEDVSDPAPTVAASLKEIHRVFRCAEETYRNFRAEFIKEEVRLPVQWVPITNQ